MKRWLLILLFIPVLVKAQTLSFCVNYSGHAPITLSGVTGITISGDSINNLGGSSVLIHLTNCSNIRITHNKLMNSSNTAIQLDNCYNVQIDSNYASNVRDGVHANYCPMGGINVHHNYFLNMNGPFPAGNAVQFNNIGGGGNRVMFNNIENIAGQAQHPQDLISVYQSNGLPGDSIMVEYNMIRGGQIINDSGGAAGIVLGDVGGSYQVARYNIVVDGGYVGMQVQGGSHIKMDHNTVYGSGTAYANDGISFGNYSGAASIDVTISYNKIKFINRFGSEVDTYWDLTTAYVPAGASTNIVHALIDATVLPTYLYVSCSASPVAPLLSYSGNIVSGVYGYAIATLTPTISGSPTITYSVSPSLPLGISLSASTGKITGTPGVLVSTTTYVITATNGGGSDTAHVTISVGKAGLTIRANNQYKSVGAVNPTLTASYIGLRNGDTPASLTTLPTITTTALTASPAGTYPITASGAAATNYNITYQPGTLTIASGPVIGGKTLGHPFIAIH
jgi:hypothetical protein